jgi:hypothetical protein
MNGNMDEEMKHVLKIGYRNQTKWAYFFYKAVVDE